MRSSRIQTNHGPWPFWLLIVAWICANSPQFATYALIAWAGEARSFSHQQRLTADLAHLLAGEESRSGVAAAAEDSPVSPSQPVIPSTATIKKVELAMESTPRPVVPPQVAVGWLMALDQIAGIARGRPPHEPPRAAVLS